MGMEIRLSAEVAAVIEADIAAGRFANVEEYVTAAVELLHERELGWMGETVEEFNAKLAESIAEAERGEQFTVEQVREEMRKMKATEELNASLDAAVVEADRDGWLDEAEIRQHMSVMKAEWAGRRTA